MTEAPLLSCPALVLPVVIAVGYGYDTASNKNYFLIKNSCGWFRGKQGLQGSNWMAPRGR
jgi:hypothetical protein